MAKTQPKKSNVKVSKHVEHKDNQVKLKKNCNARNTPKSRRIAKKVLSPEMQIASVQEIKETILTRFPDKKIWDWQPYAVYMICVAGVSAYDLSETLQVTPHTIYNHTTGDPDIAQIMSEIRDQQFEYVERQVNSLLGLAMTRFAELIEHADNDSTSLKAILALFKQAKIIDDSVDLNIKSIPTIQIITKKEDEED